MLVVLQCGDQSSLFEAKGFSDLFQQATDAFGALVRPNMELALQYDFNGLNITVRCNQGLDTFMKIKAKERGNADVPPALHVRQTKPLAIPGATGGVPLTAIPTSVPSSSKSESQPIASSGARVASNNGFGGNVVVDDEPVPEVRKAKKSAKRGVHPSVAGRARPTDDQVAADAAAEDDVVRNPQYPEGSFTQPISARALLQSFAPPSKPELPGVRCIKRDGSFSCKVPLDYDAPPLMAEFVNQLWRRCKAAKVCTGGAGETISLSLVLPEAGIDEFDLEDTKDMAMLIRYMKQYGEYAMHILVEFNTDFYTNDPELDVEVLAEEAEEDGGSPFKRPPLGVNLCHTPLRDRSAANSPARSRPATPGNSLPPSRPQSSLAGRRSNLD